jgi:DNA helicase-2/ATP-dependent DNA helicase PcrA
MFYTADLHIHSHYAKATSKYLTLESLHQWAQVKGIDVLGTGDFTHPGWFSELKEKLQPIGNGLFRLKQPPATPVLEGMRVKGKEPLFCLSAEISCEYHYDNRPRKNHHLVYAPDFDTAERINTRLATLTDLAADGRPTIHISSRDLLEIVLQSSDTAYLVPAHAWTPWFSTFGSVAGYDSLSDCFRDLSSHIFALETGLSSDPAMNRRCSQLDHLTMMSSSDAHKPQNLGREVNLFDTELSYDGLFNAVKTGNGFKGTWEFYPEEGKYSNDGHDACNVSMERPETERHKGICPVCGKPLTIGVMHRVDLLADREEALHPPGDTGFDYIIPLPEILSELLGASVQSKKVMHAFSQAITAFGNEFTLLREAPVDDIGRYHKKLGEAIHRMRSGQVKRISGFDGRYGQIILFAKGELPTRTPEQLSIF